jgi:uncharacterized protein
MPYESGFIQSRRGSQLFYVKEGPAGASSAWVFCNPFFEEKLFTQRVYRNFARTLAGLGHTVLRFDYEGDGDSDGDVRTIGLQDRLHDLEDLCGFVRKNGAIRSIGLFGLRFGGTLAFLGARAAGAREVLAWAPVLDGPRCFQELIRFNLTTQLGAYKKVLTKSEQLVAELEKGGTIPVLGHDLGARLAFDMRDLSLDNVTLGPDCRCRVIVTSRKPASATPETVPGLPSSWRAEVRGVPVQPFWHEPTFHDPRQQALVDASLAMIREAT